MNSQMGTKTPAPGFNLFKNMPPLVGQKRPSNTLSKPAPSLNLLANLSQYKKDLIKQKSQQGQDKSMSDEGVSDSKNNEKMDLTAQLDELDQRAGKRLKISTKEQSRNINVETNVPMTGTVQKVYESSENGGTYHMVLKNASSTKAGTTEGADSREDSL